MEKLLGYCGLDCASCDAYRATKMDDPVLREKTAKLWSELNGVEIIPEQINCEGCRGEGKKTVFCEHICRIRQCALDRKMETCGACPTRAVCESWQSFAVNNPSVGISFGE